MTLNLRLWGRKETDAAVSKFRPAYERVTCGVKKNKVPILWDDVEWATALMDYKGLPAGRSNNWSRCLSIMQGLEVVRKDGKAYAFRGETWKTLKSIGEWFEEEPGAYDECLTLCVDAAEEGS